MRRFRVGARSKGRQVSPFREPARVTPDPSREAADLRLREANAERSRRRMQTLKWAGVCIGIVLLLAALITAAVMFGLRLDAREQRKARACEARGGVWLSSDDACVPGFQR